VTDMIDRLALEVSCPTCGVEAHVACEGGVIHPARRPHEVVEHPGQRKPRVQPRRTCEIAHAGKRMFSSRGKAEAALRRIRKMGERHEQGKPVRPYRCAICGKWALTSRPM